MSQPSRPQDPTVSQPDLATPTPGQPEPISSTQASASQLTPDKCQKNSQVPPKKILTPQRLQRRSFGRWLIMAPMRLSYRFWTRIAAHIFPEGTRRAHLAERVGIPLPDRLDLSWVTANLAVGGRPRLEDIPLLARKGITRVVDTRAEYRDDEDALNQEGIQLLHLPTPDTHPLSLEHLMVGTKWVLCQIQEGQKVLIHCEHGVGRSVLLTCASLVRDGYSSDSATRLVQSKRWQASPNHRQIKRLHEFEEALRANAQNQLKQAGEQPEHAM
ncbi:MAG TPA: dual specificity protein phosphatase [Ktedonobacterales bacterium]|jgi:protein-tyrosine phosphatase